MSRRKFIESHRATCKNWNWSWSFVNHKEKFIIFGAWDTQTNGGCSLIFSEAWEHRNRKPPGFKESLEHISLIENQGYELKTFVIVKEEYQDKNGNYKSKIKSFEEKLEAKNLIKIGQDWYANSINNKIDYDGEVREDKEYSEGTVKTVLANSYERSKKAREACIAHYGSCCQICKINFGKKYGAIVEGLIHVHHIVSISEIGEEYKIDPIKDLIPVCPNCHAVIHRTKPALSIFQVKELLNNVK